MIEILGRAAEMLLALVVLLFAGVAVWLAILAVCSWRAKSE